MASVVSSYSVGIKCKGKGRELFGPTVDFFREACAFLTAVVDTEWYDLVDLNAHERILFVEHLVHTTKKNTALYPDFDLAFPKMPSYLRRAAIQQAIGADSSWRSNYMNWLENGQKGNPPKLSLNRFIMPVFYRGDMYRETAEKDTALLKLYNGHDWVWQQVRLVHTDVRYLEKYWSHVKASAPTPEYKHGQYSLRFCYEENIELSDAKPENQIICAVDLGINTDAVCSILDAKGTVLGRKFIDNPRDKDRLNRVLGRIRRFRREHRTSSVRGLWEYAKRLNDELSRKIASAIAEYAYLEGADVIVFEYLDFRGKKARWRSKAQKLHMWKRNDIQKRCEHDAHRLGMRISHVNAWNTSRLAYDGSGPLTRSETNRQNATFSTGKKYNADLSASYNIGARYFIRELLKPLSAKRRCLILAKVPECGSRSTCTLSSLWKLAAALAV